MTRLLLLLPWLALAACGDLEEPTPTAMSAAPSAAAPPPAGPETPSDWSAPAALPNDASDRMVIRTASLQLRTDNPRGLIGEATGLAAGAGGFVISSRTAAISDSVTEVTIEMRVASEHFDGVLHELRGMGRVLEEQITGQDVTEEYVDVEAQIRTLRQLEERLLALSATTGNVKDLLGVEHELARVRGDVERLQGRAVYLIDRSRLSTISLVARSPDQPHVAAFESFGSRVGGAFSDGWQTCVVIVEGVIVLAVGSLPLSALLLAVGLPLWRRHRRTPVAPLAHEQM